LVKPMDRPPFRFAVQATSAAGGREWYDTVRKVEDLGYSTLFQADHYLGPGPAQRAARTPRQDLAPIAAMGAAAAGSQKLRIGCRVFCVDYHAPAILAKEAATLDLLSDGRLELGLGAGWMRSDYEESGIAYDAPAVRVDRFEEGVAIITGLLESEGPFSFTGQHYTVTGHTATPRPTQRPRPPIIIGGGGKR